MVIPKARPPRTSCPSILANRVGASGACASTTSPRLSRSTAVRARVTRSAASSRRCMTSSSRTARPGSGAASSSPTTAASSVRMAVSLPTLRSAWRPAAKRPVLESTRTSANRSPMAAMTPCALSYAVVTAPTSTSRPVHVKVPAVSPDVPFPAPVIDLAEGGEHAGPHVPVHRQDGRDVLDDEHAAVPQLAEQPSGGVAAALPLRRRRQKGTLGSDGARDRRPGPGQGRDRLRLRVPGAGHEEQPDGSPSSCSTAAAASTASSATRS